LLKRFGNGAIKKDRERFNTTNKLIVKGELRSVPNKPNELISGADSQTRGVINYAERIEQKFDASKLPPNVIM
jgi:hypothetical protein